jgi:hypothetical protein
MLSYRKNGPKLIQILKLYKKHDSIKYEYYIFFFFFRRDIFIL